MFPVCSIPGKSRYNAAVAHNISRPKQEENDRQRRVAALGPYLVPGWQIDQAGRRIIEIKSILGACQRGQQIVFRCQRKDCRRRIELDLVGAVRAGLGDRTEIDLMGMLRCRHWENCGLQEAQALYPKGVPLVAYVTDTSALIAMTCGRCRRRALLPATKMIDRLIRSQKGDASTGIIELAAKASKPCRACGHRTFESSIEWIKPAKTGDATTRASSL